MQPNNTNNQEYTNAPVQNQTPTPQPAPSAQFESGIMPQTPANLEKQTTLALWLSISSIAIFVTALLFGYILWIAALLGAYGLAIGIRVKSTKIIVLGSIGLFLNGVGYFVLPLLFPAV